MRNHASVRFLGFLAVALLWAVPPLLADVTGSILGTVTDPSGAAVPGAAITLSNPDTGLTRKTTTDAVGSYEFLAVPVGQNYIIEAEAAGFQKAREAGIKLLVNQKYRADLQLVVGALTQTVSVTAEAAQVETSSNQLGDVIEDRKMTGLPLNGRSYIDLLGLQAGVVPIASDDAVNDRQVSGNGNPGIMSVNGQRESANSFLVNGGDVEESVNNGASIVPTLDSIQEFRLLTNSFSAEYGRFSGAIVNVITKSGTNQFHGSGYEFLRNEKLDARNFFDMNQTDPLSGRELPGTARGVFKRNQFGGTFGGPVLRNRVFFFSDYQGTREIRGVSTGNIAVPSLTQRGGDLSDLAAAGFSPFGCVSNEPDTAGMSCAPADMAETNPIYQPTISTVRGGTAPGNMPATLSSRLGYPVNPGEPYWIPGCNTLADAQAGMCVFWGQVIPPAVWSPVAQKTLKFIPTATGISEGQPFFSSSAERQVLRDDKFGQRLDFNSDRTGNWSFYYYFDDSRYLSPFPAFTSNVPGFSAVTPSRAQQFNSSNTHIFGPTAVNELHLNYTRMAMLKNKPVGGLGKITDFGYVSGGLGVIPSDPNVEGVAPISLDNTGVAFGLPDGTTGQYNNTFQIADNFSKIVGKHTAKFGIDLRYVQINERNTYTSNGWFTFSGTETGNDFADYLLGAPDLFNQTSRQYLDSRTKYVGLYAQDTYRVTPNFTLNYGLRWDLSQPFYDTQGRIQVFLPGQQSSVYPDAPTGFVFPGDKGIPKTLAPTKYDNFAPRFGFAYSPGISDGVLGKIFGGPGKTSIRGAFGMYYTAIEDLTLFNEVGDAPFGLFYVSPVPVYLEEPYKARTTDTDPGQRFPFKIPPPGATGIWPQYLPMATAPTFKHDNKLPYAEHFNFTLQRAIRTSAILTVSVVGTRGHHLLATVESNPGDPAKCLQIAAVMPAGQGCGPYGEDTIYDLGTGQFAYGTRPYSVTSGRSLSDGLLDFSSNTWEATMANSNYNSLQVSLEKRAGALRLLGAYTWSKSLDNSSGFYDQINPFNPRVSKSLSGYDMTHNFVVSYSYDLPFQHLVKSSARVVHGLLNGWVVSGITRFTTGLPITLSEGDDASLCGCGGVDRPNYDGQPIRYFAPRTAPDHRFFSADPFSPETTGVAGNANRRFFHGPGLNNWDFTLHKTTRITERTSIEFRAELFNTFNHAQFENPSGNVLGSRFGRVSGARDARIGQMALKFYF